MKPDPSLPLVVHSDRTVLLEVDNPHYADARDQLARFAELEKSPEHIHTYRVTPLSLWNAAASGLTADQILRSLHTFSKYPIPENLETEIREFVARYGRVKLLKRDEDLVLVSDDAMLVAEIWHSRAVRRYLLAWESDHSLLVKPHQRGHVKQALIHIGYPVEDLAGYVRGAFLDLALRETTRDEEPFQVRPYQSDSAEAFYAGGSAHGGSGVIVLPCGAGKTIVGMICMGLLQTQTLVLCTSVVAVHQWRRELLDKSTLSEQEIGEYTSEIKEARPVTITTYQMITYRRRKGEPFRYFELFNKMDWGLIIYDEVHLLPAPVFRITAEIQARRRLGLTATLVREDHREEDVFSLIGPKRYDMPWKVLERQGWIASAQCIEVRVPLPRETRSEYVVASPRQKFRIASESIAKDALVRQIIGHHQDDLVLIIGQYLRQLRRLAKWLDAPLITGNTPNEAREKLYQAFRTGQIRLLLVSRVGNFAVDLPDANVAIQVSGTFGSRQEEAQRLGRILRPKAKGCVAHFYSLVSRETRDQEFAANRQLFLTEQGYSYHIRDSNEFARTLDEQAD